MSQISIEAALDQLLGTLAGGGEVNLAGAPYRPRQGVPYVSARVSAYNRRPVSAGPVPVYQIDGMYQVSVFRPAGEGKIAAGQIAARLLALFRRSTVVVTSDGLQVSLISVTEGPRVEQAEWFQVPVMVAFFASEVG